MVSGRFPLKTNPLIDAWASIELGRHAAMGLPALQRTRLRFAVQGTTQLPWS